MTGAPPAAPPARYPRLVGDLDALAAIGRDPEGGWSRPAFGPDDRRAHDWFAATAAAAGLDVRRDAFGNVFARSPGAGAEPVLMIGSHLDTVPRGGRLDGALGVLAGLEVARRMLQSGATARIPVEVAAFRDEEGRFGAYSGSRAMLGLLPAGELGRMKASDGTTLDAALREAGLDPDAVATAVRDPAEIRAYLELHIEQGPVLEAAGRAIGIVEAIAGQARLALRFTGAPDHSGTTPMALRHDAFAAAARFADRFRDAILARGGPETRGTIGIVRVEPNAGNVVPSDVRLGLEIRDTDAARLDALAAETAALAERVAGETAVAAQCRAIYRTAPVPMDPALAGLLAAAARALGHEPLTLPSGAGHDAAMLADRVPTAMLFVPSIGGRSHCPEEDTRLADIEAGVAVLEATVARLLAGGG